MDARLNKKQKEVVVKRDVADSVTLELTLEEAIALYMLVGSISGSPEGTIREYTDSMYHALGTLLLPEVGYCSNFVSGTVGNSSSSHKAPNGHQAVSFIKNVAQNIRERD